MGKLLHVLVVAAISLVLTGPAAAGGRVDWSEYIDRSPRKPIAVAPAKETHVSKRATKATKAKKAKKATNARKAKKVAKSKKATKTRKKTTKKKARR